MKKYSDNPSKGEQKIIEILCKENITYVREKMFADIKDRYYRFDFYLPDYDCCIEYDGEQHFKQQEIFQKTRSDFLRQQENDRIKNSFCLSHHIKLFRIPFWKINSINTLQDIFSSEFLVKNKYHNDNLWRKRKDAPHFT